MFLSSPGDVGDERAIAVDVLDRLRYDEELRGRADFEVVAWDRPGASAPILATRTPQASIDRGMARPAECDIVVVIFWSRLGTALPHPEYRRADGEPYGSGTEWEFEDAVRGAQERGVPEVLLYRRTPMVPVDPEAPDADEHWRQGRLVRAFFERHRDPRTGAILRGHNVYRTPDEFRTNLESHLKALALRLVGQPTEQVDALPPPLWQGSPFPGLRAFTPRDARIYFGRGHETDELVARVSAGSFVAVVGASGTGKSSLIGAGLLPRLAAGAVPGWALPEYDAERGAWSALRLTPAQFPAEARSGSLYDRMMSRATAALASRPPEAEALLFVDQFEELFTAVPDELVEPVVAALAAVVATPRVRVVVTIRSDFYHRCLELPQLASLLETGQFPVSAPADTLYEMIIRPAERAGLAFEEGLVGRILSDTGRGQGALPLLAYTLDELYRTRGAASTLGHAAYDGLGGVQGAIGTRAEATFRRLDEQAQAAFSRVFRELVEIDEHGLATRRRAEVARIAVDEAARQLVEEFTAARLLVRGAESGRDAVVSVAHEALFASWTRLNRWVELVREDLHVLRRFRAAARDWHENDRADAYRWQHERLTPVYEMIGRLDPALEEAELEFARPEHERLLPSFRDPAVARYRRQALLDRLVAIGEAAIPGLVAALHVVAPEVRNSAAAALARIGEPAVPELTEVARADDAELQLVALTALRQIDVPEVLPSFRRALRDKDERVRSLAIGALASMTTPGAATVVTDAMTDRGLDVRWRAVGALGALGEVGIMPLLTAARDDHPAIRATARTALQTVGAQYVDLLMDALRSNEAKTRSAAAAALAGAGRPVAAAVAVALGDEDVDVRWRAAEVLAAGAGGPEAVAGLLGVLPDPHPMVRRTAAEALGVIGAAEAIPALVTALADQHAEVAEAAAHALAAIGEPSVPALLEVLGGDAPRPVQHLAANALARTGQPGMRTLAASLGHPDPDTATLAVDALVGRGAAAAPTLLIALRDASAHSHRAAVVAALRGIGDAATPQILAELDRAPEPAVRQAIAEALGDTLSYDARSALVRLLHDDHAATGAAAARSLARFGHSSLPILLRALHKPSTRAAAAEGLRLAGGEAVPELLTLAREDSPVRDTAIGLLRVIDTPAAVLGLSELGLFSA